MGHGFPKALPCIILSLRRATVAPPLCVVDADRSHADPCPLLKAPNWAREHQNWITEQYIKVAQ